MNPLMKFIFIIIAIVTSFNINAFDTRLEVFTYKEFKEQILKNSMSMEQWIEQVSNDGTSFICLGETHQDTFRNFLNHNFFSKYYTDILYLESSKSDLESITTQLIEEDPSHVKLLGAPIGNIINTASNLNQNLVILPAEPNEEQERYARNYNNIQYSKYISKDSIIAQSFLYSLQPTKRHVALYGANHCARHDIGLSNTPFMRIIDPFFKTAKITSKSVLLIDENYSNFFYIYLSILGLAKKTLVIPDTKKSIPNITTLSGNYMKFSQITTP